MATLRNLLKAALSGAPSLASLCIRQAENKHAIVLAVSTRVPTAFTNVVVARKLVTHAAAAAAAAAAPPSNQSAASLLRHTIQSFRRRAFGTFTASPSPSTATAITVTPAAALTAGLTPGTRRALALWLAGGSAWVYSMVVLGGVTRLTRSGLSMTDWKFTGERPPSTPAQWLQEFEQYKQSPEFKLVNASMTIEEFKFIYWMEWGHRMWGRALGLFFALPATVFLARGAINGALGRRLALLFLMGGSQGLVGWWMVRSGLVEPRDNRVPRVAATRLAAHLTSAFAIYATMVWTTLQVAFPHPPVVTSGPPGARAAAALYRVALPVAVLLGITAVSGAFVAGNDAGHAYNTFPTMNGEWIPEEYWEGGGSWKTLFFENTASVQLHHRCLAITTLIAAVALWRYGMRMPDLPKPSKMLLHGLVAGVAAQVSLGVATLLTYVPVSLGAAHQGGAMALFTIALGLLYTVRPAPTLAPFRLLTSPPLSTMSAVAAVVAVGGAVANAT